MSASVPIRAKMGKKIGRCLKAKQKKKTKTTIKTAEKESRLLRQIHSGNGIAGVSKNAIGATLGAVLARRGITVGEGAGGVDGDGFGKYDA